ncbi:MAG TPA: hypothetical protein VGC55_17180 [Dokdonella sp.]
MKMRHGNAVTPFGLGALVLFAAGTAAVVPARADIAMTTRHLSIDTEAPGDATRGSGGAAAADPSAIERLVDNLRGRDSSGGKPRAASHLREAVFGDGFQGALE